MLSIKWFLFFFAVIAVCGLLSGFISGSMGQEPPWNPLMATVNQISSIEDVLFSIPALIGNIGTLLWNMFFWNYTFLDGQPWIYIKWFVFFPISAAFAIATMIMFAGMIRGSGS